MSLFISFAIGFIAGSLFVTYVPTKEERNNRKTYNSNDN